MRKLLDHTLDHWLAWVVFTSVLMLAAAHAFETFGGYAPCTLCLRQREVYWVGGSVALAGLLAKQRLGIGGIDRTLNGLLTFIFAVGAATAIYHAGAEWKFWPGPTTCSGGGGINVKSLTALANGTAQIKPPACDEAAWRLFGISMAGFNALVSLKLTIFCGLAARGIRFKS
jgi:disulfide bond formation protein DsbB